MKHALIVGSGIAGLSAAWWLHKRFPHIRLSILEKEARPGGLIITEKQFQNMEIITGEYSTDVIDSDERLVIL